MLAGNDLTSLRHELGAELAAPCAKFEGPVLPCALLNGRNVFPRFVVARAIAMMHGIEDPQLRFARGLQNFQHVGDAVVGFGNGLDARPDLATFGNEVVVGIDH